MSKFWEDHTHHAQNISLTSLKKILKLIFSQNLWTKNTRDIQRICNSLEDRFKKEESSLDKDFYKFITRMVEDRGEWDDIIKNLIPLYPLLDEKSKLDFAKKIINFILASPPKKDIDHVIWTAYAMEVWNPIHNEAIFEILVKRVLNSRLKDIQDEEEKRQGTPLSNRRIELAWKLRPIVRLIYAYNLFNKSYVENIYQQVTSEKYKWILKPNEFDYSKFQVEWLLSFNDGEILKELKKIDKLVEAVKNHLSNNYSSEIAEIYFKSLL